MTGVFLLLCGSLLPRMILSASPHPDPLDVLIGFAEGVEFGFVELLVVKWRCGRRNRGRGRGARGEPPHNSLQQTQHGNEIRVKPKLSSRENLNRVLSVNFGKTFCETSGEHEFPDAMDTDQLLKKHIRAHIDFIVLARSTPFLGVEPIEKRLCQMIVWSTRGLTPSSLVP